MPSILLAEDHSVVRMGTILLIRQLYPNVEISEAETFDETLKKLEQQSFNMLLLNIHIPGGDNLQVIEAVKMRQRDTAVLIFSSYDERLYALRYLQAGAKGFLQRKSAAEEIKLAIQTVLNKGKYISRDVRNQMLNQLIDSEKREIDVNTLSNREMEVMQLLVKGASPSEIKIALNIQDSTISTYKARIFEKMNVSNIIDLAERVKLVSP